MTYRRSLLASQRGLQPCGIITELQPFAERRGPCTESKPCF